MEWDVIKEIFFAIGSAAGVLALAKPVFESKDIRDKKRFEYLSDILSEELFRNLEFCITQRRRIPGDIFNALDKVTYEIEENIEKLRFSGPFSKWYINELHEIRDSYLSLRKLIQVPFWEPYYVSEDDDSEYEWRFNKQEFKTENGSLRRYDEHLLNAGKLSIRAWEAYRRLQIINEAHMYEYPLAFWLLPRRFELLKMNKNET